MLPARKITISFSSTDRVHLSRAGHEVVAATVQKAIETYSR